MKRLAVLGLTAVLAASTAFAGDVKSGLQPGAQVGAFNVEKVCGNPNDDVADGKSLCYRCKLGNKPVVMVFSRTTNDPLASLVKELDATLPKHEDVKLSSFVNLIGSADAGELKSAAKEFVEKTKTENVAIVVPAESENGPKAFDISPEAEVTVIIYRNGKVAANHAFGEGKLDKDGIAAVIADAVKMVN